MTNKLHIEFVEPDFRKKMDIIRAIDKPAAEMSVQDICDNVGISRQTFYRHFASKDDMLCWVGQFFRKITIGEIGERYTWLEGYTKYYELMRDEKGFFVSLTSVEYLQDDAFRQYYDQFVEMIEARGIELSSQLHFAIWGQSLMDLKFSTKWVKDGMKIDPEELAELVVECIPIPLFRILEEGS